MTPILRRILQLLVLIALQAILLFVSAGTLGWRICGALRSRCGTVGPSRLPRQAAIDCSRRWIIG